ncbi:MAG: hypothetical protein P8X69_04125 [Maritimibacter sp.]
MPDEAAPCICHQFPAGGSDPAPLITEGRVILLDRIVHGGKHCTEYRLECSDCGKRWWVVEDDTSHWQRKGFTWHPHRPLDLI